jgi:hypothetical protein
MMIEKIESTFRDSGVDAELLLSFPSTLIVDMGPVGFGPRPAYKTFLLFFFFYCFFDSAAANNRSCLSTETTNSLYKVLHCMSRIKHTHGFKPFALNIE